MIISMLVVEDNIGDFELLKEYCEECEADFLVDHVRTLAKMKEQLENKSYDVILLDLGLPDSHGINTILESKPYFSSTSTILLTGFEDDKLATEALKLGVQDYLVKDELNSKSLWKSILFSIYRKKQDDSLDLLEHGNLSNREYQIAHLIIDGLTNDEMSDRLGISKHTIKNHITRLLNKLNVTNRHELMAKLFKDKHNSN